MRPLVLHIEGFGVFREPIDVDFDGVDYFALIGPTGAGKSTVIDAICFALYGSVPRYGDERQVARVVSVGKLEAKVSLTFAIGDDRFRVTRVVRIRNGKATTPEAILEALDPAGGAPHMLAGRAKELKPAVEQLLGLPFAHFTKCVVLPQGEFARFLHDEPSKRRDLLTRLLDLQIYDKIGQLARQRAAAAKHAVDIHQRQREELSGASDDARAATMTRLDALRALHKALDAARPEDDAQAATIAEFETSARRSRELATQLEAVAVPKDVAKLTATRDAATSTALGAAEASAAAGLALTELDEQVGALPERVGLERLHAAHTERAALGERLLAARTAEETAVADEAQVAAVAQRAAEHLAATQTAIDELRDTHAAHALRAHLVAGEPCPVCEQVIETVPKRKRLTAASQAEAALAEAHRLAGDAQRAGHQAAHALGDARARTAQLVERGEELDAALVGSLPPDELEKELARVDKILRAHAAARAHDRAARSAEQEADVRMRSLDEQLREHWAAHHDQRDEFVRAGLDPPALGEDLVASWSALQQWSKAARSEQQALATSAYEEAERVRGVRAERVEAFRARAEALGVTAPGRELSELRDSVLEHGHDARSALQQIDDAIERAKKLESEIRAAREEYEVAELLGARLRSDRFEKWLLVEAIGALVVSASSILYALSAGSYSLRSSDEDEFVVVDHRNADEPRSVRTLSGGETFQASLALALALSDQLAELSATGGRKLEAIFLDEGFGTLDADALETVAGTIEALGTSGRMVGIVTHVPALADRVPVRYRVTRTDRSARVDREDL